MIHDTTRMSLKIWHGAYYDKIKDGPIAPHKENLKRSTIEDTYEATI